MVRVLFFVLAVIGAFHTVASVIQGKVKLGFDNFELDYSLDTAAGNIRFSLTSGGKYDWYAFGLHKDDESAGMPDAEVFICSPQPSNFAGVFCQVGNTLKGHTTPALAKTQYIQLHTAGRSPNWANASFTRSVEKSKAAKLSYDIMNKTVTVISAGGYWSGKPMPNGTPMRHSTNDYADVNFFEPKPEQGGFRTSKP